MPRGRHEQDGKHTPPHEDDEHTGRPLLTSRRTAIGLGVLGALGIAGAGTAAVTHPRLLAGSSRSPGPGGDPRADWPGDEDDLPAAGRVRAVLDALPDRAGQVPHLTTTDLSSTLGRHVSYPVLSSSHGLTEAVDVCVGKLLRERVARGTHATVTATGTVVAAGKDTLGVLLDVQEDEGHSVGAVWYRADGDRPFTSPGLIAPDHWADLCEHVVRAADHIRGTDEDALRSLLQEQPRPFGNGPTLIPDADGRMQVLFPRVGDGELAVTLPADVTASLLGKDGQAVAAAIASPTDFDPGSVRVPGRGEHSGATVYCPPEKTGEGSDARRGPDGPGPRTQLAPRAAAGTAPSSVVAPDARLLRAVALTFDDGPSKELNGRLRDMLGQAGAAATFFMIGQNVRDAPTLAADTAGDGHQLGSHTWSHVRLSTLPAGGQDRELSRAADAIRTACGRTALVLRPPYGDRDRATDEAAGRAGQSAQLWDVDSLDWKTLDRTQNLQHVSEETVRGSIILMHEIHEPSVASVPAILDWLGTHHYTTLTCSEVGQNQMYAGKHYFQGLVHETPVA
jgi:peptidoglycan/xylan/chitin deacetylase (PgdA/CDA1 family)